MASFCGVQVQTLDLPANQLSTFPLSANNYGWGWGSFWKCTVNVQSTLVANQAILHYVPRHNFPMFTISKKLEFDGRLAAKCICWPQHHLIWISVMASFGTNPTRRPPRRRRNMLLLLELAHNTVFGHAVNKAICFVLFQNLATAHGRR